MDKFDTSALLRRVEKLERQNRWMKLAGLIVLLGVASMLFYGAKTSKKVIEAEEFRLIDENGKLWAGLETTGDGAILSFFNKRGKVCMDMSVSSEGPLISLYGRDGHGAALVLGAEAEPRAILGTTGDGAILNLLDKRGKLCINMNAGEEGSQVFLYGRNGHANISSLSGGPALVLGDENKRPRVFLGTTLEGPALNFLDERRLPRAFYTSTGLECYDENGKCRILLRTEKEASNLILYNKRGQEMFSAP